MISTIYTHNETVLKLNANRSANWQQTKWLILLLVGPSLIMGTIWFFLGAWVILPVAGFEALIFAYLLYRVSCSTYQWQLVTKKDEQLWVEAGSLKTQQQSCFDLKSTRLIKHQRGDGSLDKVLLLNNGQCLELGAFLNTDERKQLFKTLIQWGLRPQPLTQQDRYRLAC